MLGTLKSHNTEQCLEMLLYTHCFHENDILINDRGFLSREMSNCLKTVHKVDTYLPARENMAIYQDAVALAVASGKWQKHPNRKSKGQEIQLVTGLGPLWESDEPEKDNSINACVVHDKKTEKFCIYDNGYSQDCPSDYTHLRTASGNRRRFPADEGFQGYIIQLYYVLYRNDCGLSLFPGIQKSG